jgi:ankyrin repeat protein
MRYTLLFFFSIYFLSSCTKGEIKKEIKNSPDNNNEIHLDNSMVKIYDKIQSQYDNHEQVLLEDEELNIIKDTIHQNKESLYKEYKELSVLIYICRTDPQYELLNYCLENNISFNRNNYNKESPFHKLCRPHYLENFKIIIDYYRDRHYKLYEAVNDLDRDNFTIFHKLVMHKNLEGLKAISDLIKNTCLERVVYKKNKKRLNPLHLAVMMNNQELIKYLITNFPELGKEEEDFLNAIDLGLIYGKVPTLQGFYQNIISNSYQSQASISKGFNPMHFCFYQMNYPMFQFLLTRSNYLLYSTTQYKDYQPLQFLFIGKRPTEIRNYFKYIDSINYKSIIKRPSRKRSSKEKIYRMNKIDMIKEIIKYVQECSLENFEFTCINLDTILKESSEYTLPDDILRLIKLYFGYNVESNYIEEVKGLCYLYQPLSKYHNQQIIQMNIK